MFLEAYIIFIVNLLGFDHMPEEQIRGYVDDCVWFLRKEQSYPPRKQSFIEKSAGTPILGRDFVVAFCFF